jgi:hypothetical protein
MPKMKIQVFSLNRITSLGNIQPKGKKEDRRTYERSLVMPQVSRFLKKKNTPISSYQDQEHRR